MTPEHLQAIRKDYQGLAKKPLAELTKPVTLSHLISHETALLVGPSLEEIFQGLIDVNQQLSQRIDRVESILQSLLERTVPSESEELETTEERPLRTIGQDPQSSS